MSLRPGIGAPALKVMADSLLRQGQSWDTGDVPRTIRIGKRTIGLGRYLLEQLRQAVGFTPDYIGEIKQDETMARSLEMLAMYQASDGSLTFKEEHTKQILTKLLQTEERYKIWKAKRGL